MYVIGLPLVAAREAVLRSKHLFGRYGRIQKVSLSHSSGAPRGRSVTTGAAHSQQGCASAYLQFASDDEARAAIHGLNNMVLEGRMLK